jgi:murein DD-endopeptidase MepM/ murein hydrolase activator NlpD
VSLKHPLPPGSYRVSSRFGPRVAPAGAKKGTAAFHTGIDYAAPIGTPVYAAADGIVGGVYRDGVGKGAINGNAVILRHTGAGGEITGTAYLHLATMAVQTGQKVARGQQIGTVGNTGQSTGPHLHFMVYVRSHPVDPGPHVDGTKPDPEDPQILPLP